MFEGRKLAEILVVERLEDLFDLLFDILEIDADSDLVQLVATDKDLDEPVVSV
jgi:hypothetical protein